MRPKEHVNIVKSDATHDHPQDPGWNLRTQRGWRLLGAAWSVGPLLARWISHWTKAPSLAFPWVDGRPSRPRAVGLAQGCTATPAMPPCGCSPQLYRLIGGTPIRSLRANDCDGWLITSRIERSPRRTGRRAPVAEKDRETARGS